MKLKDIKAPEGFKIRGFEMPVEGDYVLSCCGEAMQVTSDDHAYHCCGIILERVWEPEIGKYYEFSDDENFNYSAIRKFSDFTRDSDVYNFMDTGSICWIYVRPVNGEFGK